MTDFELLKNITQKVEGENLREMMIACVGYGNYMDVLPKILARKTCFNLESSCNGNIWSVPWKMVQQPSTVSYSKQRIKAGPCWLTENMN